jgi:hypothetical protein
MLSSTGTFSSCPAKDVRIEDRAVAHRHLHVLFDDQFPVARL